jgi:mono/diheme cytochrome c family protein
LILAWAVVSFAEQPQRPTVWTGIYTAEQAARGHAAYDADCGSCHQSDLSGYGDLLAGSVFMNHWREDNLGSFYNRLRATMPRGAPASLSDQKYLEIVAFILQSNGFPAGKADLTLAALKSIQIEEKDGPQPVPEFSLVKTTGCVAQDSHGEWMLDHALATQRTRNPDESTATELKNAAGLSGKGVVRFLRLSSYDVTAFHLEARKGYKVEAKGFLIRKDGGETLNLTSIGTVSVSCPP